jgi:hypothetical protein
LFEIVLDLLLLVEMSALVELRAKGVIGGSLLPLFLEGEEGVVVGE